MCGSLLHLVLGIRHSGWAGDRGGAARCRGGNRDDREFRHMRGVESEPGDPPQSQSRAEPVDEMDEIGGIGGIALANVEIRLLGILGARRPRPRGE